MIKIKRELRHKLCLICNIDYYIMKLYYWILLKYNFKLKEIPLYQIYSRQRFNLGDTNYNWDGLYRSLLKTDGLDLKNYLAPVVYSVCWDGEDMSTKHVLEQGFKYRVADGNHRIAALQFININRKNDPYIKHVMIKVIVGDEYFMDKLNKYNLIREYKQKIFPRLSRKINK